MGRSGWETALVGTLVIVGVLAAVGYIGNVHQLRFLGPLFLWGVLAAIVFPSILRGLEEFRAGSDWTRLAGLVPLVAVVVIAGGLWLAFHASLIWLVIVAGAVVAMLVLRHVAEDRQREKHRKQILEMPQLGKTSGASPKEDFKNWQ
jgi:hypothetical protein